MSTTLAGPETAIAAAPGGAGPFVGTAALLRLALRRDRILLPSWIVGLAAMAAFSVAATKDLYGSAAARVEAADAINATASLVALYGKVYDPSSLGALSLIKMTAFGCALVSVVWVFLVVRHTRSEEEAGRLELVAAGAVGRWAPLTAALSLGGLSAVALGLLTAGGLVAVGLPAAGSLAFGLAWALSGLVFSAVAGVTAQVSPAHRVATGLGLVAVGAAYALRAVGDLAEGDPGWLSWLSPIGWSQQIRPFAGDRWWVVAIPLLATVVLVPLAFALRDRRDLGGGFVADRAGPAQGRLAGVAALAWRLQRGMVLAWVLGAGVMGLVLGSVAHNVAGLLDSPQMRSFLVLLGGEQGLVDMFLAAEVAILGALVSAYGIAAAARLRSEEVGGRVELVLSTATTRVRWAASHLVLALAGVTVVLAVTGAAIGTAHGFAVGDPAGQAVRLAGAALAQAPAAWVVTSVVAVLFGWVPRWVSAAWAVLVTGIVLGEFGELWGLPTWVLDLSPFAHSPTLPGGTVSWPALLGLTGVAAGLVTVGLVGWRRRDVQP